MIVVMSVNNEVLTGVFQIKDSCCSASHGCHICDIQVEGWSSGLAMADILRQFSYNVSIEDKHYVFSLESNCKQNCRMKTDTGPSDCLGLFFPFNKNFSAKANMQRSQQRQQ